MTNNVNFVVAAYVVMWVGLLGYVWRLRTLRSRVDAELLRTAAGGQQ